MKLGMGWRKTTRGALVCLALAFGMSTAGCNDTVETPQCEHFWGYARVTGIAQDFDGVPMDSAGVEFVVADGSDCPSDFGPVIHRGTSDEEGRFDVVLWVADAKGERCVRGRVVRSEAVSEGLVEFTSDCDDVPPANLALDLTATPSAVIPTDLRITLYRQGSLGVGPHYQVAVDATGSIEFEGINNTIVSSAEGSVDPTALARLYRAFENIGYWDIKSLYEPEECSPYRFDVHSSSTSLRANGREHWVGHDHGCCGVPIYDDLTGLECEIDTALGTIQWTGSEALPCVWGPGQVCPPSE